MNKYQREVIKSARFLFRIGLCKSWKSAFREAKAIYRWNHQDMTGKIKKYGVCGIDWGNEA